MAGFIASKKQVEAGELQHLLFRCQGRFYAKHGRELFPEKIEIWRDGPVVREVLNSSHSENYELLTDEEKETVLEVIGEIS